MAGVRGFDYFVSRQRCIETWPPGVRLKFRIGAEELIAARARRDKFPFRDCSNTRFLYGASVFASRRT